MIRHGQGPEVRWRTEATDVPMYVCMYACMYDICMYICMYTSIERDLGSLLCLVSQPTRPKQSKLYYQKMDARYPNLSKAELLKFSDHAHGHRYHRCCTRHLTKPPRPSSVSHTSDHHISICPDNLSFHKKITPLVAWKGTILTGDESSSNHQFSGIC